MKLNLKKILQNKLINNLFTIINIIIGLTLIVLYLYFRFIRERLPKDIPVNLSLTGFFILIYICCIYFYIVWTLCRPPREANEIIQSFINFVYYPVKKADFKIKELPIIKHYYEKFMLSLIEILKSSLEKNSLLYVIFLIIPRIILISVLMLDIYYYHKLYFIYKIIIIGSFILFGKYFMYSVKTFRDNMLLELTNICEKILVENIPGAFPQPVQDSSDDEEEDDDERPETIVVSIKEFIEVYVEQKIYNNYEMYFMSLWSWDKGHWDKLAVKYYKDNPKLFKDSVEYNNENKRIKNHIENILKLSLIKGYYDYYHKKLASIKKIKILIFTNYLLCWLNILIVSIMTVDFSNMISIIDFINSIQIFEDPFSDLSLNYYEQEKIEQYEDNT